MLPSVCPSSCRQDDELAASNERTVRNNPLTFDTQDEVGV